jgi:hypothetical protein
MTMTLRRRKFTKLFFFGSNHLIYLALSLVLLMSPVCRADWGAGFVGYTGGNVQAYGTAVDGSGNIYLTGNFNSATLVAGGVTLNRIGTRDAFVIKMDSTGTVLWAKNYGGSGASAYGNAISVDGSANVYLAGVFQTSNLTTPALTKIGTIDLFTLKLDSSGNTTWAKNFGGAGGASLSVNAITSDGSGNVYVGASFQSADLTTPALTKIGSGDALALKLDSSGNTTWAKNYGGSGAFSAINGVAIDGSGNVYLGGSFQSANLTTPALTKIGAGDVLALKLDSSGNTTWTKNFGGSGANAYASSVAVDGSGNVYLGASFQSASLTTPALSILGAGDALALKLDSSGNVTWAKNFGGSGVNAYAYGIAVDGSGNVYLAGDFQSASLTTPVLTKIGTNDALALKLDSSGNTTWAKNFGGAGASIYSNGFAIDGSGNVYLGAYLQTASLTTPALTKIGIFDAISIKLDSSGTTTLAKNFGGYSPTGTIVINGVAKDPDSGAIFLVGHTTAARAQFGSFSYIRTGTQDAFVVKLDALGTVLWVKNFGGAGSAAVYANAIALDSSGNVYLGGYFSGANLTNPALTKIGTGDAFATKLDSSGTVVWAKNYGGAGAMAYGQSIAVDSGGNVYLGGYLSFASLTTPVVTKIGTSDALAFKLDSGGNLTWVKNFGGSGATMTGRGIAVDGSGNVYLGGDFSGANLTTPALSLIGAQDSTTFKLDSSGTVTWAKNFGGSGATVTGRGIAVDGSGYVYLGGDLSGANLTTPALTAIGLADVLALKLDSSGATTWAKNFGGSGAIAVGNGIAVDGIGNVYLGGNFQTANLTTPALTKIGTRDALALKLNSSGTSTWAKNYGGSTASISNNGIAIDGTGNIILSGNFSAANLTTPALTKIGTIDGLLIDAQVFNVACTTAGKVKYDSANNVMVFCDGSFWQAMNSSSASTCTGTTAGKLQYYSNGASSDMVWYGGSCRSAKATTTYGACAVNGKWEWSGANSTIRGCINGTWTSLKGW